MGFYEVSFHLVVDSRVSLERAPRPLRGGGGGLGLGCRVCFGLWGKLGRS